MTDAIELKPLAKTLTTKEHLEQLIEMCKMVFPEYSAWSYYEGGLITYFYGKGKSSSIHWLELCLTHLPNKMYGDIEDFLIDGEWSTARKFIAIAFSKNIHPVSYLYENVFSEYKTKIRYS